jgi:tartrate-resistant acid phosphatase type 5
MIWKYPVLAISAALTLVSGEPRGSPEKSTMDPSLTFLVMGDWGGQGGVPCTLLNQCTTREEKATATGMKMIGDQINARFSVALGDNFYSTGVENVESKRFKLTFEDVFKNDIPFHVIAGNHDHLGNVSAEIAYTARSKRWSYPSLYYTFTEKAGNQTVQFVMTDTVVLSGNCHVPNSDVELHGNELGGPENVDAAESQMRWIEETLAASTADYLIVAGHYPVYSICEHGPTSYLVKNIKPLLTRYNASAWINGHDHCAEYIDVGDGVQYHTIGSAHENNDNTQHKDDIPKGSLKFHTGKGDGGFASVAVSSDEMVFTHYDGSGKLLYTAPGIKPRK